MRPRAISILTALLLFLDGIAAESIHTESVVISGAGAVLAPHACGDKERHIPLDRIHDCAACAASIEGNALPPLSGGEAAILAAFPGAPARTVAPSSSIRPSASSRAPPRHS